MYNGARRLGDHNLIQYALHGWASVLGWLAWAGDGHRRLGPGPGQLPFGLRALHQLVAVVIAL